MTPTIALFTDSDAFAGTERHILDLARGLQEAGVAVRIACPARTPLAERAMSAGFTHEPIEKNGLIDRQAVSTLARLLKRGEVQVVHAHNGRTALSAALAVTMARTGRCVVSQHFVQPNRVSRQGLAGAVSRGAHGWVQGRVHRFIAVSAAVRNGMLERKETDPARISLIPNGIWPIPDAQLAAPESIRAELKIPESAPLIVCVARLEPEKDVSTLIQAMTKVREQEPDAVCVVAGTGSQREMLEGQIRTARLESTVRLLGFRTDAPSIIRAGNLLVLPSLEEPAGLVLLEAMAVGKPVVATRSGGPAEIVQDGETGLLVSPQNAEELAQALLRLVRSPALCAEMGASGHLRFAHRYTAERMARLTLDAYHQALDPSQTKA